jgi:hypothetical protein
MLRASETLHCDVPNRSTMDSILGGRYGVNR